MSAHYGGKPQLRPTADAEILIKNLRLLDLDEEFDWPDIRADTFAESNSAAAASARLQIGEWVLYKLFEAWDPETTQKVCAVQPSFAMEVLADCGALQTLQSHFPASGPETCARLLSELSKCLDRLRNDGVLSKDAVSSRKVLQDCKGARFERLLAELSTQVLYKRIVGDGDDRSAAGQALRHGNPLKQAQTTPMRLAYKHALKGQLRERAILDRRWHKFSRTLNTRNEALQLEEQLADVAGSPRKDKKIPRRTLDRLHKHIDTNWAGDKAWIDVLLLGDNRQVQNQLLERPFEDVWGHATKDTLYTIRAEQTGSILQDLERRVQEQSSRLEKWKTVRGDLSRMANSTTNPKERSLHSLSGESSWEDISSTKNDQSNNEQRKNRAMEAEKTAKHLVEDEPAIRGNHRVRTKSTLKGPSKSTDDPTPREESSQRVYHLRSRAGDASQQAPRKSNMPQDTDELDQNNARDARPTQYSSEAFDRKPPELKPLPSLAERTRMSMALASPTRQESAATSQIKAAPALLERPVSAGKMDQGTQLQASDQMENLADRARQSMNLMTAKTPAPKRPQKTRTSSADFTKSAALPKRTQTAAEVDTTLLEETIQNLGADYDSVFKSRPRIAVSPVLSPRSGGRGIAEVLDLNGHASGEEDDFS